MSENANGYTCLDFNGSVSCGARSTIKYTPQEDAESVTENAHKLKEELQRTEETQHLMSDIKWWILTIIRVLTIISLTVVACSVLIVLWNGFKAWRGRADPPRLDWSAGCEQLDTGIVKNSWVVKRLIYLGPFPSLAEHWELYLEIYHGDNAAGVAGGYASRGSMIRLDLGNDGGLLFVWGSQPHVNCEAVEEAPSVDKYQDASSIFCHSCNNFFSQWRWYDIYVASICVILLLVLLFKPKQREKETKPKDRAFPVLAALPFCYLLLSVIVDSIQFVSPVFSPEFKRGLEGHQVYEFGMPTASFQDKSVQDMKSLSMAYLNSHPHYQLDGDNCQVYATSMSRHIISEETISNTVGAVQDGKMLWFSLFLVLAFFILTTVLLYRLHEIVKKEIEDHNARRKKAKELQEKLHSFKTEFKKGVEELDGIAN